MAREIKEARYTCDRCGQEIKLENASSGHQQIYCRLCYELRYGWLDEPAGRGVMLNMPDDPRLIPGIWEQLVRTNLVEAEDEDDVESLRYNWRVDFTIMTYFKMKFENCTAPGKSELWYIAQCEAEAAELIFEAFCEEYGLSITEPPQYPVQLPLLFLA